MQSAVQNQEKCVSFLSKGKGSPHCSKGMWSIAVSFIGTPQTCGLLGYKFNTVCNDGLLKDRVMSKCRGMLSGDS